MNREINYQLINSQGVTLKPELMLYILPMLHLLCTVKLNLRLFLNFKCEVC
jgi:hypothetical protein